MLAPIRIQVDVGKWKFQAVLCHESHLELDEESEDPDEISAELDGAGRLDVHTALSDDEVPYFGFAPIPVYDDEEAW